MAAEVTAAQVANKAIDKAEVLINAAADKATDLFSAAANIITKGIDQYGQTVIDAVLWVVRIDAIQTLFSAWVMLMAIMGITYWIWTGFTRREWGKLVDNSEGFLLVPVGLFFIVAGIWVVASGLPTVTNVWLYTAVAKPELYMVKRTIDMVEAKLKAPEKK